MNNPYNFSYLAKPSLVSHSSTQSETWRTPRRYSSRCSGELNCRPEDQSPSNINLLVPIGSYFNFDSLHFRAIIVKRF